MAEQHCLFQRLAVLLAASTGVLQASACAAPKPARPEASIVPAPPVVSAAAAQPSVVALAVSEAQPPDKRQWPACQQPTGAPRFEAWPLLEFQRAARHEVEADSARINVRATLSALKAVDPCAESNEHWWPGQKCIGSRFVMLTLTGGPNEASLDALATLSFWGGSLDIGRQFEFSLGFCRGASDSSPVVQVFGYEALGRVAGGDANECRATNHEHWPFRPIDLLRVNDVLPGGFRTTGIVSQCFEPKPCPRGARCKPQSAPYLTLSVSAEPAAPTLRLEGSCGSRFQLGQRYELAVVLHSTDTMGFVNLGYPCPSPVLLR